MGKSFEIRPTGIAHAELMIPEKLAPHYPKAKGLGGAGRVVEHYSWKKVTTNVSGFILGSPTIDHYGDMKVCVLGDGACFFDLLSVFVLFRSSITGLGMFAYLRSNLVVGVVKTPLRSSDRSWTPMGT